MLIIKLRVVAAFEAREKAFAAFESTKMAKSLDSDALGAVRSSLIGDLKVKAQQNRQMDNLIKLIQ